MKTIIAPLQTSESRVSDTYEGAKVQSYPPAQELGAQSLAPLHPHTPKSQGLPQALRASTEGAASGGSSGLLQTQRHKNSGFGGSGPWYLALAIH